MQTMLLVVIALWIPGPGVAAAQRPERTAEVRPEDSRTLDRARQLLASGELDEAVTVLRQMVRREPDNADAHLLLGRALALVPEPTEAVAAIRRAVELRPSADAFHALGTVLARFVDTAGARAAFGRALALDERFADVHVSLALLLAREKELAPAREHLARAIEIQGASRDAAYSHYVMAQVLREQAEPERALQHLAAAIELRSDYADAYRVQGLIKRQLLDERGALAAFEMAVKLSPDDPAARAELGAAYLRHDRAVDAIPHLEQAARLKPDDRSTRYHLCRALQLAGRGKEAAACARQMAAGLEQSAAGELAAGKANNEGIALEAAGDLAGALERYRAAVSLDPHNTLFRRNAALALCRLGRWDDGIAELEKVLAIDPNDEQATRALYLARERVKRPKRR